MLTLLIYLAACGLIFYLWRDSREKNDWEWSMFLFFGPLIISTILNAFICAMSTDISTIEQYRTNIKIPIYSIRNINSVGGQFFLGSGTIKSTEFYYMFAKNPDGGLYRYTVSTNKAIIYQDEDSKPYIHYQDITTRPSKWICFIPFSGHKVTVKALHVPSNTVVEKFQVD